MTPKTFLSGGTVFASSLVIVTYGTVRRTSRQRQAYLQFVMHYSAI